MKVYTVAVVLLTISLPLVPADYFDYDDDEDDDPWYPWEETFGEVEYSLLKIHLAIKEARLSSRKDSLTNIQQTVTKMADTVYDLEDDTIIIIYKTATGLNTQTTERMNQYEKQAKAFQVDISDCMDTMHEHGIEIAFNFTETSTACLTEEMGKAYKIVMDLTLALSEIMRTSFSEDGYDEDEEFSTSQIIKATALLAGVRLSLKTCLTKALATANVSVYNLEKEALECISPRLQ